MGVLACDRLGCKNIMCDRVSEKHGYICDECFEELVATGIDTNIETFMGTYTKVNLLMPPREFYNNEFPNRF